MAACSAATGEQSRRSGRLRTIHNIRLIGSDLPRSAQCRTVTGPESGLQVPTNAPPRNEHLPGKWISGEKRASHGGKRDGNRRRPASGAGRIESRHRDRPRQRSDRQRRDVDRDSHPGTGSRLGSTRRTPHSPAAPATWKASGSAGAWPEPRSSAGSSWRSRWSSSISRPPPASIPIAFFVLAYVAGGTFATITALRDLFLERTVSVDFLMITAAIGAAIVGHWEEGAILLGLFSTSNALEHHALGRTQRAVRALMELSPEVATVLRDGQERVVPIEELRLGEVVLVRPGERVAVDGCVLAGETAIDQAAITGESIPVEQAASATPASRGRSTATARSRCGSTGCTRRARWPGSSSSSSRRRRRRAPPSASPTASRGGTRSG